MKIRTKLLLLFLALFGTLLLAFAVFIYISSANAREKEFFKHLRSEAITKANLLLDAKISPVVLQLIYKNAPNNLFEEEVAVYDTSFKLLYHDAVQIDKVKETRQMIDSIIRENEITFTKGRLQVVGFLYNYHHTDYVITAAAEDQYGLENLSKLRYTLLLSFLGIITLTVFAGYFFVRKALKPVGEIVEKVEEITATNLDLRVPVQSEKDEIGELAVTFNKMLDRLENSFDAQKSFVSNISHELRTPLATLVGELQVALVRDRTKEEYIQIIGLVLTDARQLTKLSNSLLDLAKANFDQTEISRKVVRIDELLMEARSAVLKAGEEYHVDIIFDREIEDDDLVSVKGNAYLLKVAFINLMENACKFSPDHRCSVTINYLSNDLVIGFKDQGVGITEADKLHIFDAFYRGSNKDYSQGNGIGLSLVQKIVNTHSGKIQVISDLGKGTTFTLNLPHVGTLTL
jgi:signal transduction histidine kinase